MKKNKGIKRSYKHKGVMFSILRIMFLLIAGVVYFMYFIIHGFHTLIGKAFLNLPRIARVTVIYSMLLIVGTGTFITYNYPKVKFEVKSISENIDIPKIEFDNTVEAKTKPKKSTVQKVCEKYSEIECKIFKTTKKHKLTTNQGYMLMAISKHETGDWTSSIYKNYHNMGGIIGSNGFRQYSSLDEGIEDFVNLLDKYYINNGRNTIELIGAKYCPVGASNDPTGLNQHWVPQVTKYYNQYVS